MSILVDKDILHAIRNGMIKIEPFDRACLGTNSYDVHLAPTLRVYMQQEFKERRVVARNGYGVASYETRVVQAPLLDCNIDNPTFDLPIPIGDGLILKPGELYLGSTIEYTESHRHVPMLTGKSSLGRLGLSIHITAGSGDIGFCNHWTLEMTVVRPLRIYAGMPIGQLLWVAASGEPDVPYDAKASAKYTNRDALPGASQMHRNFE